MTAFRAIATAAYTAPATPKTIVIPATAQVGDQIWLQWSAGSAPTLDPSFTGWVQRASGLSGSAVLWSRLVQAGDPGRTVTVEAGGGASKVALNMMVISSVDQVNPVAVVNTSSETVSQTSHVGPTLAMGAVNGKVLQFYFSKEPTASSSRPISGAYTIESDLTNGSATNAQVAAAAISNADVTGSIGAVTWGPVSQASANVFMVAVGITPVSTTIGVFPQSDVALPSGAIIVGGTTGWAVEGDSDDGTYVGFGISGTAQHLIERFGSSGTPLQGPLQTFSLRVLLNGATSVVVVPTLRNGTTPINAQASHTFTADGTFTWTVSGPDQAAQTDLTNVQVDFSITGS
jgi:hypothetical protein